MIERTRGGQARISDDDFVEFAPELVGQISTSTVNFDLHTKLNVYRRSSVLEYIVWRVSDREIDWFTLRAGQFERPLTDVAEILRSAVFPGLWLDPAALVAGDMPRVADVLRNGLASAEHQTFVLRLSQSE